MLPRLHHLVIPGLALGLAITSSPASAADFRLSIGQTFSDVGQVGDPSFDDITLPLVSPDGTRAIYIHDAETDGAYELWSAPIGGGPPVRLSGLLPSGERAYANRFTPDGTRLLYYAPQDTLGALELFVVPIAGPANSFVKLNAALGAGSRIRVLGVSPDSSRVAYAVCSSTGASCTELWVATLDGATRTLVHQSGPGRILLGEGVAPDLSRFVFVEDNQNVGSVIEVWSILIAGGAPVRLNGVLVSGGDATSFDISPAGDRVLYLADQQTDGVKEAYVVPIGGGGALKINAPLGATQDVEFAFFLPDSDRVLFRVTTSGGGQDLWSARNDGSGGAVKLNPALAGGDITPVAWAPTTGLLAYVANQQSASVHELYRVPITGGTSTKLHGPLGAGGNIVTSPLPMTTPDGTRLIFMADAVVDERFELFSVPLAGGAVTRLNPTITATGADWDVLDFNLNADGSRVLMNWQSKTCDSCTLLSRGYSNGVTGGTALRFDGCNTTLDNVIGTPVPVDTQQTLYIADQELNGRYDLYVGDTCLFCNGFEGGGLLRWKTVP